AMRRVCTSSTERRAANSMACSSRREARCFSVVVVGFPMVFSLINLAGEHTANLYHFAHQQCRDIRLLSGRVRAVARTGRAPAEPRAFPTTQSRAVQAGVASQTETVRSSVRRGR